MKHYLLLLFSLLYLSHTSAQELKVCGIHWPPFSVVKNQSFVGGSSLEIYAEAFRRLQIDIAPQVIPWQRCTRGVAEGVYDAVMDAGVSSHPLLLFGNIPTTFNPIAVFVREDSTVQRYDSEMLKGQRIGIPRGYIGYLKIANQHGWSIQETADETNSLQMLKLKRFDYALLDLTNTAHLSDELNIQVKYLQPLVHTQKLSLGFNEKHLALVKRFDEVMEGMIHDGFMDKIYHKYFSYGYRDISQKY